MRGSKMEVYFLKKIATFVHYQNYNSSNPEFRIVVSKKEAYHQFGNSVAVPVIKRLAQEIVNQLLNKS